MSTTVTILIKSRDVEQRVLLSRIVSWFQHARSRVRLARAARAKLRVAGQRHLEGLLYRQRLADTRRFNNEVVPPSLEILAYTALVQITLSSEFRNLHEQITTQRTADASVLHGDELRRDLYNLLRVDVHSRHVVDDHRDLQAVLFRFEHVFQNTCLSCAEEAGEDSDGQPTVGECLDVVFHA